MGAISDRLAAARSAAVAQSGLQKATAVAATPAKAQVIPRTPSKSVSVLRPEDLIPRRTKESQVLFRCLKPNFNFFLAGMGKRTVHVSFQNQHLLTEDTDIIAYARKNAKHFSIEEIKQEIKQPDPVKPADTQKAGQA